jgi:hypothetical protein
MPTLTRTSKSTPETLTRRTVDGTIYVLSSDGHTEYRVTVSPSRARARDSLFAASAATPPPRRRATASLSRTRSRAMRVGS